MKNVPQHVAVIMDGNGRWAQKQNKPRIYGHQIGVQRVEELLESAPKYGVKYLTLYSFSKENWQRPAAEVAFLMKILGEYLDAKLRKFMDNNIVFNVIGDTKDLPADIQAKIRRNMETTKKNTGLVATLALSYSSRYEIIETCRSLAGQVRDGKLRPEEIDEKTFSSRLYTANLPDPDLLIRTSGELRISNFLLWQISYSELYITDKCWPDFTEEEFVKALKDYGKRERRFGLTSAAQEASV